MQRAQEANGANNFVWIQLSYVQDCTSICIQSSRLVLKVECLESAFSMMWSREFPSCASALKLLFFVFFSVSCKQCDSPNLTCRKCPESLNYRPPVINQLFTTSLTISDLDTFSFYSIEVRCDSLQSFCHSQVLGIIYSINERVAI